MASKKTSKSRQRQSIKDLSPRERQAKKVRGGVGGTLLPPKPPLSPPFGP